MITEILFQIVNNVIVLKTKNANQMVIVKQQLASRLVNLFKLLTNGEAGQLAYKN